MSKPINFGNKNGQNILKKMLRKLVAYEGEGKLAHNKKFLAILLYGALNGQDGYLDLAKSMYMLSESKMKWKDKDDGDVPEEPNNNANKEANNALKSIMELLNQEDK